MSVDAANQEPDTDAAWWTAARIRVQAAVERAGVTIEEIAADHTLGSASPSLTAERLRATLEGESDLTIPQLRAIADATGKTMYGLLAPKLEGVEEPAEATIRTLMNIIANGKESEWLTPANAQSWTKELKVVLRRLRRATQLEAELARRDSSN